MNLFDLSGFESFCWERVNASFVAFGSYVFWIWAKIVRQLDETAALVLPSSLNQKI